MKFVKLLNDEGKVYGSYTDFWRLVELSGFETIEQSEFNLDIDDDLVCYVLNGNVREWMKRKRKCRLIGFQLERPTDEYADFVPPEMDEVWLCDRWLASEYRTEKTKYVPIGGHTDLGVLPHPEKEWDFAVMSYLWGRREQIVNDMAKKYTMAPKGWPPERDRILARCRMGLCLHQTPHPVLEPLRMTLFACCRLPLVCEVSHDYHPYRVYGVQEIERAKVDADHKVEANYEYLTGHGNFRRQIENALA